MREELSVILPCYNEAKNISLLLERYRDVAKRIPIELVLVNNGSLDDTESVLKNILPKYKFARSVKVKKNIGYGFGVLAGLKAAKCEFLSYSHADMQCDPEDILRGWKMLSGRRDVMVKGNRKGRKVFLTSCFHFLSFMLFFRRFSDINGQPKIFHRSFLKKFHNPPYDASLDFYVQYAALRSGMQVVDFPVKFRKRLHGKSWWNKGILPRLKFMVSATSYLLRLRFSKSKISTD
ncbi:MAG: glycosyltransferase family 2 protein [Candidatus Aenigmarchaeota archaeon]|nr:glycosyltransferase family 2 protein [Candidatus Aenigmarchaeota archaeon]